MHQQKYNEEAITTLKPFGNDLILLSKLVAYIEKQIPIFSKSRMLVNPQDQTYYIFLNIRNSDLEKMLQDISPYGAVKP